MGSPVCYMSDSSLDRALQRSRTWQAARGCSLRRGLGAQVRKEALWECETYGGLRGLKLRQGPGQNKTKLCLG